MHGTLTLSAVSPHGCSASTRVWFRAGAVVHPQSQLSGSGSFLQPRRTDRSAPAQCGRDSVVASGCSGPANRTVRSRAQFAPFMGARVKRFYGGSSLGDTTARFGGVNQGRHAPVPRTGRQTGPGNRSGRPAGLCGSHVVVTGCCQPASLLRIDPPGPHFC
jgi:hypothetical protein